MAVCATAVIVSTTRLSDTALIPALERRIEGSTKGPWEWSSVWV
jgi:hypothetical protein